MPQTKGKKRNIRPKQDLHPTPSPPTVLLGFLENFCDWYRYGNSLLIKYSLGGTFVARLHSRILYCLLHWLLLSFISTMYILHMLYETYRNIFIVLWTYNITQIWRKNNILTLLYSLIRCSISKYIPLSPGVTGIYISEVPRSDKGSTPGAIPSDFMVRKNPNGIW